MLTIQRASAGSGKTYTLARTYIGMLLTIPVERQQRDSAGNQKTRLRTPEEIADSMRHILAVTFTNKATEEMKQRIVERLADLYAAGFSPLPADRSLWPDYLDDMARATGADPQEIARAAGIALRSLLYNYSDFNVSTIDSFFQTLLRTFAYETDLNDSYQLEIDTASTNMAAVDATLTAISNAENPTARAWIDLLMSETLQNGKKWDLYQKSESKHSLYATLLRHIAKMESEDFKENLQKLNDYFASRHNLRNVYDRIAAAVEEPAEKAHEKAVEEGRKLEFLFKQGGLDIAVYGSSHLASNLQKLIHGSYDTSKPPKFRKKPFTTAADKKNDITASPAKEEIEAAYTRFTDSYEALTDILGSDNYRRWRLYKPLLPYVPLLHIVSEQIHELLQQQNLMQISDTNTLLRKIIGDDETPFIYERLGTRINHYLIDEFQDTSRMQWENFEPLVSESLSEDYDNLLIGDAKQSIYRFRNAEPSLITDYVPEKYPDHRDAGSSDAENTNHRSLRRVVEFNNSFFRFLSDTLSPELGRLYSNVEQPAAKKEDSGYVRIRLYIADKAEDSGDDGEGIANPEIREAGKIVAKLIERGYRQKDIAFLTVTNKEAKQIIDSLVGYNAGVTDDKKIEFISDESLLVANSRAVRTVVATLRAIAEGLDSWRGSGNETDTGAPPAPLQWRNVASRFAYLASQEPESEPWRILESIMGGSSPGSEISEMLSEMQSATLPSLTEAIIERFVQQNLRRQDAVFLAAFQDAVLGYVENKPADISSFLQWWDVNAPKLSIASPEDVDAVKVMTIHKSKGLEFPVVIIPKAGMNFKKQSSRWEWVEPAADFPCATELPPVVPLEVKRCKDDPDYGALYAEEEGKIMMDTLNLVYVGFTRAVNELYVYCPLQKNANAKSGNTEIMNKPLLGNYLLKYLRSQPRIGGEICGLEECGDSGEIPVFAYGRMLTRAEISALGDKKTKDQKIKRIKPHSCKRIIDDYKSGSDCGMLKYKAMDEPEAIEGSDPRDEGNLMHDIMSRVIRAEDLPGAVKSVVIGGLVGPGEAGVIRSKLEEAIASVAGKEWFDGSRRVITERSVAAAGEGKAGIRRPDRIMIDSEGNVEIVDYKFGHHTDVESYRKQMAEYMSLLGRSGRYAGIRGYIWYVTEGTIEETLI